MFVKWVRFMCGPTNGSKITRVAHFISFAVVCGSLSRLILKWEIWTRRCGIVALAFWMVRVVSIRNAHRTWKRIWSLKSRSRFDLWLKYEEKSDSSVNYTEIASRRPFLKVSSPVQYSARSLSRCYHLFIILGWLFQYLTQKINK